MRTLAAALLALTLTAFAGTAPAASQPTELTPAEAYRAGLISLASGRPELALAIAEALLQRDPDDHDALLLKSRAARDAGQNARAIAAGRAAWRAAETGRERHGAAMVTAQALSSAGARTRAQLWLRRAAGSAPDTATRAQAVRDFRYVRARNPWATELSFNIAPTSNVNNGSARETTQLYGMPFEFQLSGAAQALEGIEYAAGLATRYRFAQDGTQAHDAVFQLSHRTYSLSADARAQAPGVSGSDFAFTQVALAYVYRRRPENGPGPWSLSVTAGHSWYGGADYFTYLRLSGGQKIELTADTGLRFSASAERQFGAASADADILRAQLRLTRKLGGLGRLGLTLGHADSASAAEVSDYSEWQTGVDFSPAKPILGIDMRFSLDWRARAYPRSRHARGGRADREIGAGIEMVFREVEYMGFNPTLSLHGTRTDSNIGLYERENLGLSLGIRSAF